jgi:hypothetical protein
VEYFPIPRATKLGNFDSRNLTCAVALATLDRWNIPHPGNVAYLMRAEVRNLLREWSLSGDPDTCARRFSSGSPRCCYRRSRARSSLDSLLEEAGFEPWVPLVRGSTSKGKR